jgi:fluoroquinolone transport system permease protein
MNRLLTVAINDFRLVFRDNSLKVFLLLPVMTLLVNRYVVPYVGKTYPFVRENVDFIVMLASMQGSLAFGFIYAMVMVDETDKNVSKVYAILPVSRRWFVVCRLIPPFLLSTAATFCLLLTSPFHDIHWWPGLVFSAGAGTLTPILALAVPTLSKNKIQAMAWQKMVSLPLYFPLLGLFLPGWAMVFFSGFPNFWMYKGLDGLMKVERYWGFLVVGPLLSFLWIHWLVGKFNRVRYQ